MQKYKTKEELQAEFEALTAEYQAWMKEQGLNLGPAEEHHLDDDLTAAQQKWLQKFRAKWDAVGFER
ncbi:hypothetical protein CU048_15165 [Beijerinckiaceae bacterium]|nr:hypothetical protein CU048_15165 [Beijerinckiaceae bacterium]